MKTHQPVRGIVCAPYGSGAQMLAREGRRAYGAGATFAGGETRHRIDTIEVAVKGENTGGISEGQLHAVRHATGVVGACYGERNQRTGSLQVRGARDIAVVVFGDRRVQWTRLAGRNESASPASGDEHRGGVTPHHFQGEDHHHHQPPRRRSPSRCCWVAWLLNSDGRRR